MTRVDLAQSIKNGWKFAVINSLATLLALFSPDYIWIPVTFVVFLSLAIYSYKKYEKEKSKTMTYLFLSWEQIAGIPIFIIWLKILKVITAGLSTDFVLGMLAYTIGAHITTVIVEGIGWYAINYKNRYRLSGIGFLEMLAGFYAGLVIGLSAYLNLDSRGFRDAQTKPGSLCREIFEYAGIARAFDWPVYILRVVGTFLAILAGLNGADAIALMLTISSFYYGTLWSALFYPLCQRRIEAGYARADTGQP